MTTILNDFIKTSDGKIAFIRSEYKAHTAQYCSFSQKWELIIWTDTLKGGRIIKYDSKEELMKISKEIMDQL